jgi:uncharacterized membrane protein YfcA
LTEIIAILSKTQPNRKVLPLRRTHIGDMEPTNCIAIPTPSDDLRQDRPARASDLHHVLDDARRQRAEALKGLLLVRAAPLSRRLALSAVAMAAILMLAWASLPSLTAPAMAIIFTASALSGVAGFAFSAICGALLFYVVPPIAGVQLMMVCSIANQCFSITALRHSIDWRVLWRFLLGGLIGMPLGIYLLLSLDATIYCRVLGAFLIAYSSFRIFRPAASRLFPRAWADVIAGLAGGITGGIVGFPGAFVTIWCGFKGWDKDRQRAVYQPFILIMQVLGLVAIAAITGVARHHVPTDALSALVYVPAALLGTWCGLGCYRRFSDAQFSLVVNVLLIVSGIALAL